MRLTCNELAELWEREFYKNSRSTWYYGFAWFRMAADMNKAAKSHAKGGIRFFLGRFASLRAISVRTTKCVRTSNNDASSLILSVVSPVA
jgi:hypothetical protein